MTRSRLLPAVKKALRRVPGLRSTYQQTRILGSIFLERFIADQRKACDRAHIRRDWDFMAPAEQERHRQVIEAIAAFRGPGNWGTALEIGCSEGIFTMELARRCRHVDAVDLSAVACTRATARCAALKNVTICREDLRGNRSETRYDIILAMCVWEYLQGPGEHAIAARNVISALRPGGLLVLNATRLPAAYESTAWARALVAGGLQIVRFLGKQKELKLLWNENAADYNVAIFEKAA